MVQTSVDPQMRGRVMALYMAVFMGGTPVGAPIIGWVGEAFGRAVDDRPRFARRRACPCWRSPCCSARRENVQVSFASHRRPRFRVRIDPVAPADVVDTPAPQAVR